MLLSRLQLALCLCAATASCRHDSTSESPAPSAEPVASDAAPLAPTATTDAASKDAKAVSWQWDQAPDLYPAVDITVQIDKGRIILGQKPFRDPRATGFPKNGTVQLTRLDESDKAVWTTTPTALSGAPHAGAAMVADNERIYIAHYYRGSTGCSLSAYALDDGRELWTSPLRGIGSIGHSKYNNRVQLRLVGGQPRVVGSESGGRYIEERDATTGALGFNQRLEAAHPRANISERLYNELNIDLAKKDTTRIAVDDFLRRHVLSEQYPKGADRQRAMAEAVGYLDGLPMRNNTFVLELKLVDPSGAASFVARRRLP